jgi:pimeloyl-ACP methyl ester carboxylesterase
VVRILIYLVAGLLICLAALGIAFWRAPIWVSQELIQLQLAASGIHSQDGVVNGYSVHYFEGGAGKPVVLIHGLGAEAQGNWAKLAITLVHAGYHVYAIDLLGYGRSAKPADSSYSIPEEAKFVEAFLDAKQLNGVVLGGVSMGGWIASRVALDQPQRVAGLLLIDSAGMAFKLSFDRALFTPERSEQLDELLAMLTPHPPAIPEFVKADLLRKSQRDGWVVKRALDSMFGGSDFLDAQFSALKMPMLIVWGKQDTLTPLALGESMHSAAPQSVLAVYDGCGHLAVVTCMDRISPTVLDFLAGKGPQPGQSIEVPVTY